MGIFVGPLRESISTEGLPLRERAGPDLEAAGWALGLGFYLIPVPAGCVYRRCTHIEGGIPRRGYLLPVHNGLGVPPDGQSSLDAAAAVPPRAPPRPCPAGARRPPTPPKELLVGWLVLRLV